MASVKYFYVEDDTAILFGANGTALTATLAAVAGMISDIKFAIPTFPLWAYFAGLIFAFISKSVIMIYNGDVKEREKSQAVRDFLLEALPEKEALAKEGVDWDKEWADMVERRKTLLSLKTTYRLNYVRAYAFFASAICFVLGTGSILWFVGTKASL